jgi:putative transposase
VDGSAARGAGGRVRGFGRWARRELSGGQIDEAVESAAGRRRRQALGVRSDRRISDDVIDELLAGACTEEEIAGPGGLLAELTKRLVERAMEVELTDHVGYEPHQEPPGGAANQRNGTSARTLITEHGKVPIDAPRDRDGSFEPKIVRKRQRRFVGFDEKILALYSRGLSVRDIRAHLRESYGVEVSLDLISRVTDAVMDDVRAWGKRPLEDIYPIVFLDCMVIKVRDGGTVGRRALYLAMGVTLEGDRDVLGMWFQESEGAKFWMQVLADLKQRGVREILIACVDGLTGFPDANRGDLPQDDRADVHRPSDPLEPALRAAARARAGRPRPETDLHRQGRTHTPVAAAGLSVILVLALGLARSLGSRATPRGAQRWFDVIAALDRNVPSIPILRAPAVGIAATAAFLLWPLHSGPTDGWAAHRRLRARRTRSHRGGHAGAPARGGPFPPLPAPGDLASGRRLRSRGHADRGRMVTAPRRPRPRRGQGRALGRSDRGRGARDHPPRAGHVAWRAHRP